MYKFCFRRLLLADYCAAKWLVNKKMPERIIPSTLHFFATPFAFIGAGLYFVIIGTISYRFETHLPILIGLGGVMLPLQFYIEKRAKKVIFKWGIEKEFNTLSKNERLNKNILAFLFFWVAFFLFFYLGVTYVGGYLIE
ncbi:hypothetical protein [Pseudotamlana agarivorans]|uniref:hypothetical protein n=1 Tax=Pseudotamlana agarivorans TaxID=481183 RepID=UPI00082D514F|nr:hypothetical protein [Tamlana agarivorans]